MQNGDILVYFLYWSYMAGKVHNSVKFNFWLGEKCFSGEGWGVSPPLWEIFINLRLLRCKMVAYLVYFLRCSCMAGSVKIYWISIFRLVKEESSLCCPREEYVVNKPSEAPSLYVRGMFSRKIRALSRQKHELLRIFSLLHMCIIWVSKGWQTPA